MNNRTNIKELYRSPQVISLSSDGNQVTFENKIVSIGNVTRETEVDPNVKFNVIGNTNMDGLVNMSKNVLIGGAAEETNVSLKVEGNAKINGTIDINELCIASDYRLKYNVKPLDHTFVIDNLRPVEYNKVNCDKKEIGFIAHELQKHYPDFVSGVKDDKFMQHVNYNNLIGILVNEIQMLKTRISHLESNL